MPPPTLYTVTVDVGIMSFLKSWTSVNDGPWCASDDKSREMFLMVNATGVVMLWQYGMPMPTTVAQVDAKEPSVAECRTSAKFTYATTPSP